jgi:hypothetical protein
MWQTIDQLPWSNASLQLFGGPGSPGRKHDHVRLVCRELSEGAITDAAVANHAAVLQFEITDIRELLLLRDDNNGEQL